MDQKSNQVVPRTTGRPPVEIDLSRVTALVADGASQKDVASALAVSDKTIGRRMAGDEDFRLAFEAGLTKRREWLRGKVQKAIDSGKAPLLLLAAANQDENRGGLGWQVPGAAKKVVNIGSIKIVVHKAYLDAPGAEPIQVIPSDLD